jgi:hypothetical protein
VPKKPKESESSPVVCLLQTVWDNALSATGHSWERLNQSMRQTLKLAVTSGFPFVAGDLKGLDKFRPGYWMGETPEWLYSLAIEENNTSAAVAFEEWKGRCPLHADDVKVSRSGAPRQQERLHVGCYFPWKGEQVKVTSFNDDGAAVACSYHPPADGGYEYERKVKRRHVITRESIIVDRAQRKERQKLQDELMAAVESGKTTRPAVMELLGAKTNEEFAAIPIKKIRKVASVVAKGTCESPAQRHA